MIRNLERECKRKRAYLPPRSFGLETQYPSCFYGESLLYYAYNLNLFLETVCRIRMTFGNQKLYSSLKTADFGTNKPAVLLVPNVSLFCVRKKEGYGCYIEYSNTLGMSAVFVCICRDGEEL